MNFSRPSTSHPPARAGLLRPLAPALLLSALLYSALCTPHSALGANVRVYFQQPQTNSLDTNAIIATPISTNILANGGIIQQGLPWRITPVSTGYATSYFNIGWYALKNTRTSAQVVIAVADSSATLYDYTNLLQSGFNTYVSVTYGTNPPPNYDEVTNALGYLPVSTNETRNVTINADLTVNNVNASEIHLSGSGADDLLSAAGDGLIESSGYSKNYLAGLPTTNSLSTTSNGLRTIITATNNAITAAYIAADTVVSNGLIAKINSVAANTNNYFVTTNDIRDLVFSQVTIGDLYTSFTPSETKYATILTDGNVQYATYGDTYIAGLPTTNSLSTTSNGLVTRLVATNAALIVSYTAADTTVSNGLVNRIIATNAALAANLTTVSNNYVRTNDSRSIRLAGSVIIGDLTATNLVLADSTGSYSVLQKDPDGTVADAGFTSYYVLGLPTTNSLSTTSNGLVTRLVATNAALIVSYTAADTIVSNGLVAKINASSSTNIAVALTNSNAQIGSDGAARLSSAMITNALAVGNLTTASGSYSMAQGVQTTASGTPSHSEGGLTVASGAYSHAEGYDTKAEATAAHAEGRFTIAAGAYSHADGYGARVTSDYSYLWADGELGTSVYTNATRGSYVVKASGGMLIDANLTNSRSMVIKSNLTAATATITNLTAPTATVSNLTATVLLFGANTNTYATTDVLSGTKAGTNIANGTYTKVSATLYTNAEFGSYMTNSTGTTWVFYSASGSAVYSSTAGPTNSSWTVLIGSASPALCTFYGEYQVGNGLVHLGPISSTNLAARLAAVTNGLPRIGTNSATVTPNITIYLTNQDGAIYRLSAEKL